MWVRRRNGSWWPGRVLGAEELADSHLMSLRSGTPVKLLGRDDASVDWYNLEKSKRVKPFRCGEFDACIEKAEASYSTPIKRREKYARREDAILHALELEGQQREIKQESTTAGNTILSICDRNSNHYTSEIHVQSKLSNQKFHNSSRKPHRDSSSIIIPGEEKHADITHGAQKDITVYSSHDAEDSVYYSKNSLKHLPDDAGNAYHLQHSGCMSNESTPSGWTEGNEFDSSATDSEFEIAEEKHSSGITQPFEITAESPMESGMSQWHLKGKRKNRTTTKRLHESFNEKKLGGSEKSDVQFKEASPDKFDSAMINDSLGQKFSSEKESDYDTEDDELFARVEIKRDDLLCQNSDYIDSDDDPRLISQSGWGSVRPSFPTWRAYWDGLEVGHQRFYGSPFNRRMMPMLVDVDLKVQARYQGEHVPLVSVVSKLNGKAIIGHAVRIEVLEDGSTDLFLLPLNESEGDATPLHIWRTAKRTVPRVPRLNPDPLNSLYVENSVPRMKKKSIYHSHRSASGRFQRKSPKTTSLSSSQKTRALSSFVTEKQLGSRGVFFSGLIKPDGSMPPTTCIPTKVVFSRIIESLGRPMGPTRL